MRSGDIDVFLWCLPHLQARCTDIVAKINRATQENYPIGVALNKPRALSHTKSSLRLWGDKWRNSAILLALGPSSIEAILVSDVMSHIFDSFLRF